MTNLKILKPATEAQKATQTTLDTIEVTPDVVRSWKLPPFQRPLRVNPKVLALSKQIREEGVIPGVLVIGVLDRERYIVDGQHRREAFLLSECLTAYVDIRVLHFDAMKDMAREFANVNQALVRMRPDDNLRALESSYDSLALLRKECAFIGYDMIRRSEKAPLLSMSAVLRCWSAAGNEVPRAAGGGAVTLAEALPVEDARQCAEFLNLAHDAWGRDAAYARLWGGLNLTICAWLYRRLVLTAYSAKTKRLTKEQFRACLSSLSAATLYVEYLVGRNFGTRDMSPAYNRIKGLFAGRLEHDTGQKWNLPSPPWASSGGGGKK